MLNMDSERHFSRGKSTPSLAGGGVTSVRHESNERSWMDMLSFVSRPAWSLLQRYLPGNSLSAAQPHNQLWDTEGLEHTIGFGHKLTRLENTRSSLQPQFLHCEHVDSGLHPSVEVGAMTWMTADSLSEIGIQTIADSGTSQSTSGYLSVARNFLSQFMLNVVSTQEVKRSQNLLAHGAASDGASVLSWTRETTVVSGTSDSNHHSGSLCHLAERTTMASVAKPTGLFVHCDDGSSKHRESAGHCCHKAAPDNDCLHMLRPVSLPREQQQQELRDQANAVSLLGDISVGCARSEVVLLTPEQDNGYSSLEEELSNSRLPSMRKAGEEQLVLVGVSESGKETEQQQHRPTEEQPELESEAQVQQVEELCGENIEQQQEEDDQAGAEQAEVSATPEEQREATESSQVSPCRNKAIAYIMGSPCSDDSSSGEDSDEDSNDEDDDDGFNSEGSSCLSDSDSSEEEEEEEDEDDDYDEESDAEEFNAETERLWNSLCQNRDPYNPRNFTASISTARPISHNASAAAAAGSSPASLQVLSSSPLSASPLSTSPLSGSEFSSSGSGEEAEDAESLRLWDSFSCSSDPYNPFNFQAPLRTRLPPAGSSGSGKAACSVPRYQREQAEERQDSGFGDEMPAPPASAQPCRKLRKVRFCEEVEEFYTSGDEDRHGPWEEFARDRCRFQRRVLEVEESISFCLTPAFRLQVYHRLQLT